MGAQAPGVNSQDRRTARRKEERERVAPAARAIPRCPECGKPALKYHSATVGYICPRGHAFKRGDAA